MGVKDAATEKKRRERTDRKKPENESGIASVRTKPNGEKKMAEAKPTTNTTQTKKKRSDRNFFSLPEKKKIIKERLLPARTKEP